MTVDIEQEKARLDSVYNAIEIPVHVYDHSPFPSRNSPDRVVVDFLNREVSLTGQRTRAAITGTHTGYLSRRAHIKTGVPALIVARKDYRTNDPDLPRLSDVAESMNVPIFFGTGNDLENELDRLEGRPLRILARQEGDGSVARVPDLHPAYREAV